jgi:hypothetical protein
MTKLAPSIIAAVAFAYVLARAILLPQGPDEWAILKLCHEHGGLWSVLTFPEACSLLPSVLTSWLCFNLLPLPDWFAIRVPSLLAMLAFLWALWRIVRSQPTWLALLFVLAALNPFTLEYFSMSQGYGQALTCCALALAFMPDKPVVSLWWAGLAVVCQMSQFPFWCGVAGWFAVVHRWRWREAWQHFAFMVFLVVRNGAQMHGTANTPGGSFQVIYEIHAANLFASLQSILADAAHTNARWVAVALAVSLIATWIYSFWRCDRLWQVGLIIAGWCLACVAMHIGAGVSYPYMRYLICLPLLFAVFWLQAGRWGIAWLALFALVTVATANLSHRTITPADTETVKVVRRVRSQTSQPVFGTSDGLKWQFWTAIENAESVLPSDRFKERGCRDMIGRFYFYEFNCGAPQVNLFYETTHLFLAPENLALTNAITGSTFALDGTYAAGWTLWRRQ